MKKIGGRYHDFKGARPQKGRRSMQNFLRFSGSAAAVLAFAAFAPTAVAQNTSRPLKKSLASGLGL
jgi:hypothetical protein